MKKVLSFPQSTDTVISSGSIRGPHRQNELTAEQFLSLTGFGEPCWSVPDAELIEFPPQPRKEIYLSRNDPKLLQLFQNAVSMEEYDPNGAVIYYQSIIDFCPTHENALVNLATLLYNRKQYVEARDLYKRATEVSPGYALAWFNFGTTCDELGEYDQAISAYKSAILCMRIIQKDYPDAHYNLAIAYEKNGQESKALEHWLCYCRFEVPKKSYTHAQGRIKAIRAKSPLEIASVEKL